jgi:hypothetical protein
MTLLSEKLVSSPQCSQGLGTLYAFTDDSSVPSVLNGLQQTDRNLVSADYFGTGDSSLWQDLKANYYQLKVGSYQPPTAGQIASGELQGVVATTLPFIEQYEGPNPDNPFVPFQPGRSAPTSMTGQSAGVQQGYAAGQQIGQILWIVAGEGVGSDTGVQTTPNSTNTSIEFTRPPLINDVDAEAGCEQRGQNTFPTSCGGVRRIISLNAGAKLSLPLPSAAS